jgi:cell division protein FtsZ
MGLVFDMVDEEIKLQPIIKVIGVGGAGGNAVAHMIKKGNNWSGVYSCEHRLQSSFS